MVSKLSLSGPQSGGVLSGLLQGGGEDEVVDVEGDGPYEEYEWCGQRRVRVSSLLRAQPQLLGESTTRCTTAGLCLWGGQI